ncbi:MAG: class I SAM-dependent methyltransferase [Verrucomicrobiota bacterium]
MQEKSTVDEIRARFDADVDRFSKLETGQSATMDAPLTLELIAQVSAAVCPRARTLLDIGCGAGNYSLKLLQVLPGLEVTLVDLSEPMLKRAMERVGAAGAAKIETVQGDIRELGPGTERFDLVVASAVLHHLRTDAEWEAVFTKVYHSLTIGGAFWISDFVEHSIPGVQQVMWKRYGDYLTGLKDADYRDHVFAYIEREDTPRSVIYQLDLLRKVGFKRVEILHKIACFAAFGGIKK